MVVTKKDLKFEKILFINSGDKLGWSRATLEISFDPLNLDSGGIRQYQVVSGSIG